MFPNGSLNSANTIRKGHQKICKDIPKSTPKLILFRIHFDAILTPFWLHFRPWGAPGPLSEATPFFNTFLTRFRLPIGLPLGSLWASILESIFESFSGTLRKRPRNAFGLIFELLCLHFGSLLGSFFRIPSKSEN